MILSCGSAKSEKPLAEKPEIKNLLLITIDTLRPDALSIYGGRVPTPFFDRFAKNALVFDNAFTSAPITLPAHTSLMTGIYPPHHGVRNNGTFSAPQNLELLSETAKRNGLQTAAVIGGFPLAAQFGLDQGFDTYDDHFNTAPAEAGSFALSEKNAASVVASAETWLSKLGQGHRYFLWLHFFDPHHPYLNHGFPSGDAYHQEVQYVDQQLGKLFEFLHQTHLDKETLSVLLSDHGEAFGEHGEVSHSLFVYQTTLHIPLLMSGPGIPNGRRKELARIIDIAPTIEALFGWNTANKQDGVSLLAASARENYAETFAPALDFGWSPLQTIHDLHKKYIQAPRPEFYDLDQDPGEERNLAGSTDLKNYRLRLASYSAPIHSESRHAPDAEERERLQSLGYFAGVSVKERANAPDPKDRVAVARDIAELTMKPMDLNQRAEAYRSLAARDPENPLLLARYAEVLLQQKQYSRANAVFQRVLDLEYPASSVYNGMAATLFYLNKPEKAEQILQQAVRLKIADGETYYNLGELLFHRGDHETAMQYYNRSLSLSFLPAYFRLARLKDVTGDYAGAIKLLNEAQQKMPEQPDVYYERAVVNYKHDHFGAALADFRAALNQSGNPSLLYNIGLTYFRMNDVTNARTYLTEFLQKAPAEMQDERRAAKEILRTARTPGP